MTRLLLSAAAVIAVLTTGAMADTIDDRQANHAERIAKARRSGELTRQEAAALRAEQARIAEVERYIKADGIVTRREAAVMDRLQDQANRNLYRESHDGEKRWFRKWW
jgi:hypothetical protein